MEKIAQRFYENDGNDRTGKREVKQKPATTCKQPVKPRIIAAEIKARDVMGDGNGGDGQRQSEQSCKTKSGEHQAVFAAFLPSCRPIIP